MLRKKINKPLFFKKSKAAKQKEEEKEYNVYPITDSQTRGRRPPPEESPQTMYQKQIREKRPPAEESPQTMYQKLSPKGRRKRENYKQEPENSGYEDEYDAYNFINQQYDYDYDYRNKQYTDEYRDQQYYSRQYYDDYEDQSMYDIESEAYGYTTEAATQYRGRPGQKMRQTYSITETAYSESESDSDCDICNNRGREKRRQRMGEMSDYSSGAPRRRKHQHRYEHRRRNYEPSDTTETERSPYRVDYNVYRAHQPVGQKAFHYDKQREQTESESETESESGKNVQSEVAMERHGGQPHYQVYAAHTSPQHGGAFQQQKGKEKVLSVMEYDRNTNNLPIVGFRDKTNSPQRSQSDVVYLPVIVMDENTDLTKSKIISPEVLMDNTAEKPLETNLQIYAAADLKQKNIFEQAKGPTQGQEELAPLEKKKSRLSMAFSKMLGKSQSKTNIQESDYPVQKSYIKTVPSKIKQSKSNTSIKSRKSVGSLLGHSKSNKTRKSKKGGKAKPAPSTSSSLISTVYPVADLKPNSQATKQSLNKATSQVNLRIGNKNQTTRNTIVNDTQNKGNQNGEIESIYQQKASIKQNQSIGETKPVHTEEEKTTIRKSMAKEETKINEQRKSLAIDETRRTQQKSQGKEAMNRREEPANPRRKSKTSIQIPSEVTKPTSDLPSRQSAAKEPSPRKSRTSRIFRKKKASKEDLPRIEEPPPEYFHKDASNPVFQPQLKIAPIKREESNEGRTRSLKKVFSNRKGQQKSPRRNEKKGVSSQLMLWGYNANALVDVFWTFQFFLGLSIHDKLMEIFTTFNPNSST